MIILGIETSCDETAAAVVKDGRHILSNIVASSAALHAKYGGIIPEIAAREQTKSLLPVITEALSQAFPQKTPSSAISALRQVTAIAVTTGPGLIGSLLVGVETAKTLTFLHHLPLIPVNHLTGHIYANWLQSAAALREGDLQPAAALREGDLQPDPASPLPRFPALALVVSGGHTDLVLIKSHGHVQLLGTTRDDAAGEAFDKTARLLHLPYPGGPYLSQLAQTGNPATYSLPRPLLNDSSLDWSFSGLKTAVISLIQKPGLHLKPADLAAAIETAIADCLVAKTLRATQKFRVPSLLLAGGVSANQTLRQKFQSSINSLPPALRPKLFIPPPTLCTDNAATIAAAAYYNYHPVPWSTLKAQPSLAITDQFPFLP